MTSDVDGYAAVIPSNGGGTQPLEVDVSADPGSGATLEFSLQVWPPILGPGLSIPEKSQPAWQLPALTLPVPFALDASGPARNLIDEWEQDLRQEKEEDSVSPAAVHNQ